MPEPTNRRLDVSQTDLQRFVTTNQWNPAPFEPYEAAENAGAVAWANSQGR